MGLHLELIVIRVGIRRGDGRVMADLLAYVAILGAHEFVSLTQDWIERL